MALLGRVTIDWTGFIGAPGYTNFHFAPAAGAAFTQAEANAAAAKVDTWLNAWTAGLPGTVTVQVRPTVEVFDDATGTLLSFLSVTTEAPQVGGGAGNYAAGSGAVLNWYTGGIRNGRRVRGRTFMVPLTSAVFQSDGTLATASLTSWRAATATMIANTDAAKLAVWSRPSAPGAGDGISYDVTAYTLPDKCAILTSRRD